MVIVAFDVRICVQNVNAFNRITLVPNVNVNVNMNMDTVNWKPHVNLSP